MSNLLIHDIKEFIDTPIASSNEKSSLQILLDKHTTDSGSIVMQLISTHTDLCIQFLNRIQAYPGGVDGLLTSPSSEALFSHVSTTSEHAVISSVIDILLRDGALKTLPQSTVNSLVSSALVWVSLENITTSNAAVSLLRKVATESSTLCEQIVQGAMDYTKKGSSATVLMRYLQLLSDIMGSGEEECFNICARHSAPEAVLRACEQPDILAQMVAIDFIPSIASTSPGLTFLLSGLHLQWLLTECTGGESGGALSVQCLSAASQVMAAAERTAHPTLAMPVYTRSVPQLLSVLTEMLSSSGEADKLSSLTSLAAYCTSSPSAMRTVLSHTPLIDAWLYLLRSQPKVQGAALHCAAQVFLYPYVLVEDCQSVLPPTPGSSSSATISTSAIPLLQQDGGIQSSLMSLTEVKKTLFNRLCPSTHGHGGSTMDYLLKLCRQPVLEAREGAIDVLRALAYQDTPDNWGLHTLIGHAGFYTYLKDRTTEFTKEGKEWKFSLISAIRYSPKSAQLSDDVIEALDTMVRQGPYFMPPRMEEPLTEER